MTTTTLNPIDFEYFEWLAEQVFVPNGKRCNDLLEIMHNTEFYWTVPNDDNRIGDSLDLRTEFLDGTKQKIQLEGATMLEILVSLSRRTAFTAGGPADRWAWKLLKNLRLDRMIDPLTEDRAERVKDILNTVIWRTYQPDGRGGFFPLKHPEEDQRKVEIWYQMNKYVIEHSGTKT